MSDDADWRRLNRARWDEAVAILRELLAIDLPSFAPRVDSDPDLGPLSPDDLVRHRPPEGESFADLCARTLPALTRLADGGRHFGIAIGDINDRRAVLVLRAVLRRGVHQQGGRAEHGRNGRDCDKSETR